MELEIPENNDEGVKKALRELNGKLRVDLMKNLLQEVGDLLYLATNATAKDADQQIKVQNTLFTALKLCDAWNLMLTSFKIGASDINEKLYIAYLKLLDGFPDFALDDVKSVTTHVSSMKAACKKAEGTFTEAKQELTDCIQSLTEDEEKMEHGAKKAVDSYRHAINELRKTYQSGFRKIEQWWDVDPAYQARLSEARKAYVDQSAKIPVCTIGKKALELALPKYHDAIGFLEKIESLVEDWYHECREVVEKQMKSNVKQAGKMSEAAQKEFWKPLPFTEEAFRYLCRWKALQLICQSTAVHLRRVRSAIDLYYTENPYPNEAIKKAWELKEKYDSLKSVEKFRDMAVPEAERNELVCCLSKLMQVKDQRNLYKGVENQMGKLEEVTEYTEVLRSIIPRKEVASVREMNVELSTFSNLILNILTKLSYYSFQNLLNVHFATLGVLDGLPDAATADIEETRCQKDKSSDDLRNAIDQLQRNIFQPENQMSCLQKKLSDEVPQMLAELDRKIMDEVRASIPGDKLMRQLKNKATTMLPSFWKPKGNVNETAIEDNMKFHELSIEVLQMLMEKLPLGDFVGTFSTINTESLCQSSTTAEKELTVIVDALKSKQIKPEQRGHAWQFGILEILKRLKDVHLGSQCQVDRIIRTMNHEEGPVRIWVQHKSTNWSVWNKSIAVRAEQIDGNVDTEVRKIRRNAMEIIKEEEEQRQRKEEEERKKREAEEQKEADDQKKRVAGDQRDQKKRKKEEGRKGEENQPKSEADKRKEGDEEQQRKREEEEQWKREAAVQNNRSLMENEGNQRPGSKAVVRETGVDIEPEGGEVSGKTSSTAGEDQGGGQSDVFAAPETLGREPQPYGTSADAVEAKDPIENQECDSTVSVLRSPQTYHGAGVGEVTDPKGRQEWNTTSTGNKSDSAKMDSSSEDATELKIPSATGTGQVYGATRKGRSDRGAASHQNTKSEGAKADLLKRSQGSGTTPRGHGGRPSYKK